MAEPLCSFLGEFILLSYIDLFSALHCCTGGGQHISALDGVGRKDERLCVCVSQSMSPSHLLYKGSLSGVQ